MQGTDNCCCTDDLPYVATLDIKGYAYALRQKPLPISLVFQSALSASTSRLLIKHVEQYNRCEIVHVCSV